MPITVSINGKEVASSVLGIEVLQGTLLRAVERFTRAAQNELREAIHRVLERLEERHSQPRLPSTGWQNDPVYSVTGRGLRAILASRQIARIKDDIVAKVTVSGYMAVHEEGAESVRPSHSQYMLVPMPWNFAKREPRGNEKTFVIRSKRGSLLVCVRRRGEIVPLYVLRKEVAIRPRLGLRAAFEGERDAVEERLAQRFFEELGA